MLFLACHSLGQRSVKQGERLQGLAQIMARRCEKSRFGRVRRLRLPLGDGQRICAAPAFSNILESDDDAFCLVASAIRQYSP
ncbi:MAG: hypothetical protein WBV55_17745, partial [Candidatus Sulfotelmatobacter sp.]